MSLLGALRWVLRTWCLSKSIPVEQTVSRVALVRGGVESRAVTACVCSSAVRRGLHVPIVAAAVVGCRGGRPSSLVSQSRFSGTSIFRLERTERVASLGVLARLAPPQRATATLWNDLHMPHQPYRNPASRENSNCTELAASYRRTLRVRAVSRLWLLFSLHENKFLSPTSRPPLRTGVARQTLRIQQRCADSAGERS